MEVYLQVVLICAVFVAVESIGCLNDAQKSAKMEMMGGWQRVEPPFDDTVKSFAMEAMQIENGRSNDMLSYDVDTDSDTDNPMEVYKQLVNGFNYCIKFEAEGSRCKNHPSENCVEQVKTKTCVVKGYKSFNSPVLVFGEPVGVKEENVKCVP